MKYSTIIFDLDGTLLNTLDDLTASVNYAMKEMGFEQHSSEKIRTFIGNGVKILIRRSVPDGITDEEYNKAYDLFEKHYAVHCRDLTAPYEGIIDVIKKLRSMGYNVAVVSNKIDFAVKKLCDDFFCGIIDTALGDSPDTNNKPAPDMVYKAVKIMGAELGRCVYVGDTDVDLETARNAGIDCISVSWGFRSHDQLKEYGAEMIADTPDELIKYLN